jgi:hypothetical protein
VIHEYSGYNVIAIHNNLLEIALLFNEMLKKSALLTDSPHFINKEMSSSSNDLPFEGI